MLPMIDIEVLGARQRVKLRALVDTGFAGYLCIPVKVAQTLGLELCGSVEVELANGQWVNNLVFSGQVEIEGVTQHAEIFVGDSETPQVGVLLLSDCQMTIDFASNEVRITRRHS